MPGLNVQQQSTLLRAPLLTNHTPQARKYSLEFSCDDSSFFIGTLRISCFIRHVCFVLRVFQHCCGISGKRSAHRRAFLIQTRCYRLQNNTNLLCSKHLEACARACPRRGPWPSVGGSQHRVGDLIRPLPQPLCSLYPVCSLLIHPSLYSLLNHWPPCYSEGAPCF
jgi:hypothetical protein